MSLIQNNSVLKNWRFMRQNNQNLHALNNHWSYFNKKTVCHATRRNGQNPNTTSDHWFYYQTKKQCVMQQDETIKIWTQHLIINSIFKQRKMCHAKRWNDQNLNTTSIYWFYFKQRNSVSWDETRQLKPDCNIRSLILF